MTKSTQTLKEKLKELLAQLPYLPQALRLVWNVARPWTIAWGILLVLQGLLPVATVYLTQAVVDNLVLAMEGGDSDQLRFTLLLVVAAAGVLLLTQVLQSLTTWVRMAQGELVRDNLSGLIHEQAASLDLTFYERPNYYDQLHRARVDAISRPVTLLENMGSLFQNSLTLIAMAGVLLPFGWWVPLVLFASTLPAFLIVLRFTIRQNEWRLRRTTDNRRARYYDVLLTDRDSAAEMRLFDLSDHFRTSYQTLQRRLRKERLDLTRDQAIAELGASVLALLMTGGLTLWVMWRVSLGEFTLGQLALFYQAFQQGQRLMRTLLSSVGQIYGNLLFLENLFEFLKLKPEVVDPVDPQPLPIPLREGIQFESISFGYPDTERQALTDFTLAIPAGQIVALVGANGAGKSTLIKLLCRFYDPTKGTITLDGVDLQNVSLNALRRQITVLFQDPVQYRDTAAQNIALSDLAAKPDAVAIEAAAQAAGAGVPIQKLPQGYQSVLGKWFGGTELSGGEWQRVALARAFLRDASIIILDEPTSAMDSWAEADWLARFRTLVAGQTAIMITHRFTTAMQADIIHVMDAGRIIETGTHTELMALDGRYAESWRAQVRQRVGQVEGEKSYGTT